MSRLTTTFCLLFAFTIAHSQPNAIRVTKTGEGEPIILLPGFTCPGSVWSETIKNLEGQNETHIVSYAGFDGMLPIKMPWYESIKKELLAYILKENLRDIKVIGHSMGGNLATDISAEMPDRFKSLVIVDAIPCMREIMMPGISAGQLQYNSPYNKSMLEMTEGALRKNAIMMAQFMTSKADKIDSLVKWSIDADRETYVYGYTDLLKLDLREVLDKITAKVLILGAPFPDRNLVATNFDKQYARLSNKTIEIATDSKHFIMFDQPEWFYKRLNAFFAK